MTKEELIKKIEALPDGISVNIFDWRKNLHHASEEATSEGVYPEFDIQIHELTPDEEEFFEEREGRPYKVWASLTFANDDYDEDGNQVI